MEYILIGVATAFNIMVVKYKFEHKRYEDGIFDLTVLFLITVVFAGSFGGLVVGTISSAILSLYFLASPPKFFSGPDGLLAKVKKEFQDYE